MDIGIEMVGEVAFVTPVKRGWQTFDCGKLRIDNLDDEGLHSWMRGKFSAKYLLEVRPVPLSARGGVKAYEAAAGFDIAFEGVALIVG